MKVTIAPRQHIIWASLVAQMVKNPPAVWETWVLPGWEDLLEEGKAIHSSILVWRIPMDRGTCRVTVRGVTESDTTGWLSTAQHSTSPMANVLTTQSRRETSYSMRAAVRIWYSWGILVEALFWWEEKETSLTSGPPSLFGGKHSASFNTTHHCSEKTTGGTQVGTAWPLCLPRKMRPRTEDSLQSWQNTSSHQLCVGLLGLLPS